MMDQITGRPNLLCMGCQRRHPGRTGPRLRREEEEVIWVEGEFLLQEGREDGELQTRVSAE